MLLLNFTPMFFEDRKKFTQRLYELANLADNRIGMNPRVASIIIKEDRIIGEGFHKIIGSEHAEIAAIKNVDKDLTLENSTILVTLEPCSHHGKTPPCAEKIIDMGIPRTIYGEMDPNPLVSGRGINKILNAGLDAKKWDDPRFKELNKVFFTNIIQKRPYIILKWAESKNGFLGIKNEQIWLSNSYSKRLVHKWRSEVNGILVGKTTFEVDKPQLNTRFGWGNSPKKFILGNLDTNLDDWTILNFPSGKNIETFIQSFYLEHKISNLMVEGGAKTLQFFLENQLWDEVRIIQTPIEINSPEGLSSPKMEGSPKSVKKLGNDTIFQYLK
jgi:diaminohydroxyphosphoribosylaminopyrimidine deaminase / 5-amino-6-(5-phosphoribosylamino)uracil reductase